MNEQCSLTSSSGGPDGGALWESGGGSLEEEAGRGVHEMGQRAHKLPRCWGRERKGNGRGAQCCRRVAPIPTRSCE